MGSAVLIKTMEMQTGALVAQIVLDMNNDLVPNSGSNGRYRPLAIDANGWSREAIRLRGYPTNIEVHDDFRDRPSQEGMRRAKTPAPTLRTSLFELTLDVLVRLRALCSADRWKGGICHEDLIRWTALVVGLELSDPKITADRQLTQTSNGLSSDKPRARVPVCQEGPAMQLDD
ncbi:MAG: hypothetical protein LQ348_006695 [Seirophora lacunosa]|nr:MAG: hypothetical protein LQ348_006695 [Seirophora lacunosa]